MSLSVNFARIYSSVIQDNMLDRVPQEHKDRANEQKDKAHDQYDRAKQFLTDEYFPEERRDQFIYRGKKVTSSHSISHDVIS